MLTDKDKQLMEGMQWADKFNKTGVGGINWQGGYSENGREKLKCLHLHLAHYIAQQSRAPFKSQSDRISSSVLIPEKLNVAGAMVAEEIGLM